MSDRLTHDSLILISPCTCFGVHSSSDEGVARSDWFGEDTRARLRARADVLMMLRVLLDDADDWEELGDAIFAKDDASSWGHHRFRVEIRALQNPRSAQHGPVLTASLFA